MMSMQDMLDEISMQWQRMRANTQLTLGGLIAALEAMPPDALIDGIKEPHSYRGYYSDLAFEPAFNKVRAADALAMCRGAMGKVFVGYKGGHFTMGERTPLWIASYGYCGLKMIALRPDGSFEKAADYE